MKPIVPFYIVFLTAALLAPLFYCNDVSWFCYLQWGGFFFAGVIWLVNISIQRGKTRMMWLASVLIYPLILFVTNPIFIGLSCRLYISKNEGQFEKINALVLPSKEHISASYLYCIAPDGFPEEKQNELEELCTELDIDISGDERFVLYLIKSEAMTGFRAALFYDPNDDNTNEYRLKHVTGHWYYQ